eukprot:gb/GECG01010025.1/.p1 GENE.gb/GECG01010025.1/~~gb/GECG01010025.1/.p1  ORF type:complete len:119 (+),score=12.70 gb/GECG01010025.1/:1-357(+)
MTSHHLTRIIKNEKAAWKREHKKATVEEKENLDTWEERQQKILGRIPPMTGDDKFVESVMWAPGTASVEALLPIYSADAAHMTRGDAFVQPLITDFMTCTVILRETYNCVFVLRVFTE